MAARGLDIPHIRTVINFDMARDIETHTHRVGRTGRAGVKGTAYTLVTEKDKEMAGHLVRNLEQANQDVSKDLMDLALKSSWFRNSRFRKGKGGSAGGGEKTGLGYKSPSGGGGGGQPRQDNSDFLTSKDSSTSGSGTGGASRMSAVKMAFKSQYLSRFQKAESASASATNTIASNALAAMPPPPPSGPPPPPPPPANPDSSTRKRKSRWE